MDYTNINKAPPIKRFKQLIDQAVYFDNNNFCYCQREVLKNASAEPNSAFFTRSQKIANTLNSVYKGGRIQFGNTYLGNSNGGFGLNYLGRLEGMPGGSGAPFKNKF